MRRLAGALALLCLLEGPLWAGSLQEKKAPRFEPIQVVSAEQTIYPMTSFASGTVVLQVTVDEAGAIRKVEAIHGIPSLTEEAEQSMRQWKFKPAELDGRTVASSIIASFTFSRSSSPSLGFSVTAESQLQEEKTSQYQPISVLSTLEAIYPAADARFGTVILQVMVDKAGAIGKVEVIHGIPSLTEEAERSVRQWKFKPAETNGQSYGCVVYI